MFEFTSSLFFWTLINFLLLLFLVSKFALPSLFKMVDESEAKKQLALAELEHNRLESRKLLAEYQEKLSQIHLEAQKVLADAALERDALRKAEVEKILAEKHEILEGIKNELSNERRQFIQEMMDNASELIVATSQKVIRRELTNQDHERLIQEDMADFERLIKEAA